MVRFPEFR